MSDNITFLNPAEIDRFMQKNHKMHRILPEINGKLQSYFPRHEFGIEILGDLETKEDVFVINVKSNGNIVEERKQLAKFDAEVEKYPDVVVRLLVE
jgi:hypothetical protein